MSEYINNTNKQEEYFKYTGKIDCFCRPVYEPVNLAKDGYVKKGGEDKTLSELQNKEQELKNKEQELENKEIALQKQQQELLTDKEKLNQEKKNYIEKPNNFVEMQQFYKRV